jgi:hypothetical protein
MRIGVLAAAADVLQGKQLLLQKHQIAAPALQEQLSLCTDVLTVAHNVLKCQQPVGCS